MWKCPLQNIDLLLSNSNKDYCTYYAAVSRIIIGVGSCHLENTVLGENEHVLAIYGSNKKVLLIIVFSTPDNSLNYVYSTIDFF